VLEKKPNTVGAEQASVEMPMSIFRNCNNNNSSRAAPSRARDSKTAEKRKARENEGFGLSAPDLGFRAVL
jgi:hypothetical protein